VAAVLFMANNFPFHFPVWFFFFGFSRFIAVGLEIFG